MATPKLIAGIDLGGTNIQIGVVRGGNKLVGAARRKTKAEEGLNGVLDRIVTGIDEACAAAGIKRARLAAVGIGAPGAVDPTTGMVLEAVNLRWDNVPLAKILTKRLKVRTFLDNDVNVAVYGENRIGSGKNARDLLGVWLGTGIGGGLILNGALYYGKFMTAGEIGHTILFPGNPPGHRSLEHNCSRSAVVDRLARLINSNRKSMLTDIAEDKDISKLKSKALGRAFQEGDPLTLEVIEDCAHNLGVAISNVVTLLSIPRVVLGGGLTEALGQSFVDLVQEYTRFYAFPDRCKKVVVVASKLKDDAGVFGAAMIAQDRI